MLSICRSRRKEALIPGAWETANLDDRRRPTVVLPLPMNRSRFHVGNKRVAGFSVLGFKARIFRGILTLNLVAADVRRLTLFRAEVRASSRRLLRFRGARREKWFRGILTPALSPLRGEGDLAAPIAPVDTPLRALVSHNLRSSRREEALTSFSRAGMSHRTSAVTRFPVSGEAAYPVSQEAAIALCTKG
jgi:hypothetical protein